MNEKTITLIAMLAAIFMPLRAWAYELGTHARITEKAYERSVLAQDPKLLNELGIRDEPKPFGELYYDISGSDVRVRKQDDFEALFMPNAEEKLTVKGWLLRGAIREDDVQVLSATIGGSHDLDPYGNNIRVLNHFYDPVRNIPLTRVTALGQRAPDWATGAANAFNAPNTPDAARRNHFTVFDAREAMYRALTGKKQNGNEIEKSADKAERHKYWATTFRALGDIVHLVEDMAQPQHARAPHTINVSSTRSPA